MSRGARLFGLRFDVDTHRCIREGVPNLLRLAAEEEVPFTFFMNMGRAVSRGAVLTRRGKADPARTPRLPVRQKLGLRGYLEAAILNPKVGSGSPDIIRQAVGAGHDVGLHGGTNHAAWQAGAARWSEQRLGQEVRYGVRAFVEVSGARPAGFASPGWHGPHALGPILSTHGFEYIADQHGPDGTLSWLTESREIVSVPTRFTGEGDGVAYLEWGRARGLDTAGILREFQAELEQCPDFAAMYDHPYHAGIHEIEVLRDMIRIARSMGFEIATLRSIAATIRSV